MQCRRSLQFDKVFRLQPLLPLLLYVVLLPFTLSVLNPMLVLQVRNVLASLFTESSVISSRMMMCLLSVLLLCAAALTYVKIADIAP